MYTMMGKVTCLNSISFYSSDNFEYSVEQKSVFNHFSTYLNRGLHLPIIPLPLTTKMWPLDHFWSLCFPLVSLLQEVGWGSLQSCRTFVNTLCSFQLFQLTQCFLLKKDKTTSGIFHDSNTTEIIVNLDTDFFWEKNVL